MKRRVIDYLCTNPGCKLASPWHQFDASTFALEEPGEYTVTLRVREVVTKQPNAVKHYPPGMQEESQRLHREYNKLVAAQLAGAKNGPDVVRLTDECNAKGIILVPNGENL